MFEAQDEDGIRNIVDKLGPKWTEELGIRPEEIQPSGAVEARRGRVFHNRAFATGLAWLGLEQPRAFQCETACASGDEAVCKTRLEGLHQFAALLCG